MAFHCLPCTPSTVHWGFLDASLPNVLLIDPGDTVRIETVSGGSSHLPLDRKRFNVLPDHQAIMGTCVPRLGPHILTGPIGVQGAEVGDLLQVKIESVELRQNWGWNEVAPGCGLLAEREESCESLILPIDLESGQVGLPWGTAVKASPFFGVMAVKPAETGAITSLIPGPFGGNLDVRWLRPKTELCFPVHAPHAGFSVGDGHALQGDGEVIGTAVETALTGQFQFTLEKRAAHLQFPYAILAKHLLTLAVDESLEHAAVLAVRQAVELLGSRHGLSTQDAYRHCSLMGNLAISQMVNIRKGVHFIVNVQGLRPVD